MLDLCVILLQNAADVGDAAQQVANSGVNLWTVGGTLGSGGGIATFYEYQKKQSKANTQLILDAISSLNSEHIKETHKVVTKENERGEMLIHKASHDTNEIRSTLTVIDKSLTGIVETLSGISKRNQASDVIQANTISIVNALVIKMEISEKVAEIKDKKNRDD